MSYCRPEVDATNLMAPRTQTILVTSSIVKTEDRIPASERLIYDEETAECMLEIEDQVTNGDLPIYSR